MLEIAAEMARIFGPYTENITISADEFCIQVLVFPGKEYHLLEGPMSVRYWENKREIMLERR